MSETQYVGKVVLLHTTPFNVICGYGFDVEDLSINPSLGFLKVYAVCGRRKREHKKVLLSAGAKAIIREVLDANVSDYYEYNIPSPFTAAYVKREHKKDKIIAYGGDADGQVLLLLKAGSGFRGSVWILNEHSTGTVLVQARAIQALGAGLAAIVHLRPGQYIVIERTGRLYGADPYVLISNKDGNIVKQPFDDLEILDEIIRGE